MINTDDEIDALENFPKDQENNDETISKENVQKYYDVETHISKPFRVKNGTVPINILEFDYSFSYDCQKYFNFCVADPNTIIFASGNIIHFLDVITKRIWFRRSATGGGIGHIIKNPIFNHIAIGENGIDPPIIIYNWPSMEIITCLFGGTKRQYSHLHYSSDGLLLVSQGGDPDYFITIWKWEESKILLQCKSHSQSVFNVMFSTFVPGSLISCGSGHIKFWRMAQTFTGLKLKGGSGRFGRTEISDIIGAYQMPDKKVISGCEWGNILLWDEDLIKFEISRKNKKFCHTKPIVQFEYINAELFTVGMDGFIRVWFYETIDLANPEPENPFLEIQPIYEFCITENDSKNLKKNAMLMGIQKQEPNDPDNTFWYAQDGNGGLWLIDLNTFKEPEVSKKIFTCHAGAISDMDVAQWGPFVATIGIDGRLHIYNYAKKKLILIYHFRDSGKQVIWLPCKIDATGSALICAFDSGVIRIVIVAVLTANEHNNIKENFTKLVQVLKPHSQSINVMSMNPSYSLLVTGSDDSTIFVFNICTTSTYPTLQPIGYIKMPSGITCMMWKPEHESTLLFGCMRGDWGEVQLPQSPQSYVKISYELTLCKPALFKFHSVKSALRIDILKKAIENKKMIKIAKKLEEMEKIKEANPGIEIDEETFLMDSEEDPPLPEIYIPEIPNKVLMIQYTNQETVWLSMAGFDAGYMYEYPVPEKNKVIGPEPIKSTIICDGDDTEIRSCLSYKQGKYLFLGMECGEIRVCKINPKDHTDLSDYWILPMHDNYNGYIPKMLLSYDHTMLLTCGHDGNLFSYRINDDTADEIIDIPQPSVPVRSLDDIHGVEDIEEPEYPTLENFIVKTEHDKVLALAKEKKEKTYQILHELTAKYSKIVDRNRNLLKSQQIPHENFELDPRITADLNKQLEMKMDLVHRKKAFQAEKSTLALKKLMDHFIEPITCIPFAVSRILKPDTMVHSIREHKLDSNFESIYAEVINCIERSKKSMIKKEKELTTEEIEGEEKQKIKDAESFLKSLNLSGIEDKLTTQIIHMLEKYKTWRAKLEERQREWNLMPKKELDPNINHPDDIAAIKLAKQTIGVYNLKDSPKLEVQDHIENLTMIKYKQYLDCKKRLHYLRDNFNTRLKKVRADKQALYSKVLQLIKTLKKIHAEIPKSNIKSLPNVPITDNDIEFPEENLQFEQYVSITEQAKHYKESISIYEIPDSTNDLIDEEYEVLLLEKKITDASEGLSFSEPSIPDISEKKIRIKSIVHPKLLQGLSFADHTETGWEHEMKHSRMLRKIYEQDCILRYIENTYKEFDKQLDELEEERLDIIAESIYMNLHLLTLHQEFIILREYEEKETLLRKNVDEKLEEEAAIIQKIHATSNKIERKKKNITKLQESIQDIAYEYLTSIQNNKFQNFLRKIFKKKYKLPKEHDDAESSSTTTTETSSEEDDEGSIDSKDMGYIYFDENVCPVGCDKALYEMAFVMREKRYEHEYEIKEENKTIEKLQKEIEMDTKKLKIFKDLLKANVDELKEFMLEKQRKLNDIDVTIILKFHQLQHFINSYTVSSIRESIVFDKTKLSHLHDRVGELQQETFNLYAKQKTNKAHLYRMKIDCKHMKSEIKNLKNKIKEEMKKKFGQPISLTNMYETVLQRMIYNIKSDLSEIMKSYEEQLKCIKEKYNEQVMVLKKLIQDNTEKLSFLIILEEEQLALRKVLKQVPISEEEMLKIELQYKGDIIKLETILASQKEQKELFLTDIKNLSMKSGALPPIYHKSDYKKNLNESEINKFATDTVNSNNCEITMSSSNVRKSNLATLIHYLISRVIESFLGTEQAELLKQEMFENIVSSFTSISNTEEIQTCVEEVIKYIENVLPINERETIDVVREAIKESLYDIIQRKITLDTNVEQLIDNDKKKIEE
ncbi:cilia- and flagella-associated protein 44 isoform X1 [Vespa velutina]|uniref:cilia- and flagella-associated protein 44 isoform X1 n=2 Tax=Vespa velutina TaxID=202808 RepID=UPI001FB1EEA5|nr:cilia- and flagella-associated protein 44 isoform X1 [Vespa velutina]